MSLDQQIGLFTTRMRTEFYTSFDAVPSPAPWEEYTTKIPSTARIEHYAWMSPTPGISQYVGHRRYGKIDTIKYSVENKEFDASFQVLLRDIEDDQTGGYEMKPRDLADKAAAFPGKRVLTTLALAKTTNCFDGSAMVASSHNIGTVNNALTYTSNGGGATGFVNDSATFRVVALYRGGRLKPLLWQDRKPPKFMNSMGTEQSSETKKVKYWIDLEGEAAFGWPHDLVWVDVTGTPNVADMGAIFNKISTAFRGFKLPKALGSDLDEYPHEQTVFGDNNLTLVCSVGIENILRNALKEQLIAVTIGSNTVAANNVYQGWAKYVVSNLI